MKTGKRTFRARRGAVTTAMGPPEQAGTALPPSDLPNAPARRPRWCDAMHRKHHRRYQERFSRLRSLARSLTASSAAGLLLALATLPVITPAQGNAQSATYRVTFDGKWTTSVTSGGLPSGAHFSPLIGAVHNDSVTFWSVGGTASAGIESMAEVGGTSTLKSEINANSNALAVIEKSLPSGGTPTATVDIAVTTAHPLVTLLSMIAPSPDWFVGVSGLSLRNTADDGWQPSLTVDLFPYDAGTEEGTEFSLTNSATSPQGTITSIKGMGKFSNEPIATLTFTRQTVAPVITTSSAIDVAENETAVATLSATDQDTAPTALMWSIPSGAAGGADATQFTLTSAGVLTFAAAKDYETPNDADGDNVYEVTVQVSDGTHTDTAVLAVTLENVIELTTLAGPEAVAYAENQAVRVATYTASSEADRDGVVWSLSGDDAAHFSIDDPGGVLRFHIDPVSPNRFPKPPDYESASDTNQDNAYTVTVTVSTAGSSTEVTTDVTVTVTDVDDAGTLALSSTRPKLGTALTATLSDADGVTGTPVYAWERSIRPNAWTVIDGATSSTYTPAAADTGTFLRATATYEDGHGAGKTATALTYEVVTASLLSGLQVTTNDSSANPSRALYPAFSADVLHYAIGCAEGGDTMTVTPTAASGVRIAVDGVQTTSGTGAMVAVRRESDVHIALTGADGAITTYVVHCMIHREWIIEASKTPGAAGILEELIMLRFYDSVAILDNNAVPRFRRAPGHPVWNYFRVDRVAGAVEQQGYDLEYRYSYVHDQPGRHSFTVLDQSLEIIDTAITTVAPLATTDLHDFRVLENGNYLLLAYEPAERDLSDLPFSHPDVEATQPQNVLDSAIQIVTPEGQAVFTWNSWENMPLEDCAQHRFPSGYAHINSLQMVDRLIIGSFRGCSKVLAIDPDHAESHKVAWRVGRTNLTAEQWEARGVGPAPMAVVGDPAGEFCAQHAAKILPNGNLLLFDNGVHCVVNPWTGEFVGRTDENYYSRGVEYALDHANGEAVFVRDHSLRGARQYLGNSQGHVDPLANGDWLISWGRARRSLAHDDPEVPIEAVTQVDPDTGEEKFSLRDPDNPVFHPRAIPLHPVALFAEPEPLTAELPDSASRSLFHNGPAARPTVVVAFNRPVVDFAAETPSVALTGATVDSVVPHSEAGTPANAYVLTLIPAGDGDITLGLMADEPCADGGICTADGTVLSKVPASHVIRADTTPPAVSKIEITSNPGSDRFYIPGDEIQVTVTFSETVEVTGTPRLSLELGGGSRTAVYEGGTGTAALVFAYEVADGESDTDGVGVEADSLSGGTIRDEGRNNAQLDHEGLSADSGHKVDGIKPELAATGGAVVNGTTLTLTYDKPLGGSSTPDAGDFTVSGGDRTRTVTRVSVRGSTVLLTLDVGAEHLEAGIRVSYTPGANRIRDLAGNQAEGLSQEPVANDTPDTTAPVVSSLAISSNPGFDQTYAAEDEIQVTVTFSETVKVTGTPRLRLRVGTRNRLAGYLRGADTAELVFGYEVADGDEDTDGVSVEANRLTLSGGTIKDEADNAAELAHEAVPAESGHKVDGVRPAFVGAAVDGSSLTLTYGEALDAGSRPASGDFTAEVGGSGRSVTGVSISGSVVTLTLDPAVEHGDTGIRVSYTVPAGVGANPIRDAAGNEAVGLSNRAATNTTDAPNTVPEITTRGPLSVGENQALVRRLAARDSDPGDEVAGWDIVGGADRFEFSIAPDTGELRFQTAPNYEAPVDVTSTDPVSGLEDNEYVVTVQVKSGAGARELTAEQTFLVRVTDEREGPEGPEAPDISGETADSLTVSWSEPENTGPAITDYDVQYREKGTGRFTDGGHEGTGLSLTLSDLEPGTAYEVQVRARNDEGTSDWSDSGEGMTVTPLTLVMASGTGPPVSGPFTVRFSFSEEVTGFTRNEIETEQVAEQDPACRDSQGNAVPCDPVIGVLQTVDGRVFSVTVTPGTNGVENNYTLRLRVAADTVSSSASGQLNQEAMLEMRVAPPGVTVEMSSIGARASGGNGTVRLSWNRPAEEGGSPIIRYEYRHAAVGEEFGAWENMAAGTRGVTVEGLINGQEYVFEVRAVNALGKGGVETVRATPELRIAPPPPRGGGGGGGGGGGLLFPPEAPAALMATPGEGMVRLEWDPPESDGGIPILRYEYRLKEIRGGFGEWTPIEDSAPGEVNAGGYTIGGLLNGTVYVFELRAVNLVDEGPETEAVEAVMLLDRAYWSNFLAEDLQGSEAGLEHTPFGGTPRSLRLRFGAGLRFEEDELDGEGEVTATRMGGYGYRYTSRTTGELSLDFDGGETCQLRLTFRGVGTGSYSYRCGGRLRGQGSFRLRGLNRGPEITGAGQFEVVENQARVVQLEAVDPDEGDEVTGYGIAGGADGVLFAVDEETGELTFREAPDYENPGDVESAEPESGAGDNEYIVVVEVSSGEGERERKGQRAIRVRVSDEEEPPEITSTGPFEVMENATTVVQLEAADPDEGDEVTGYGIAGGADGALFAVDEGTGELVFGEAPDYENPGDVESAEPESGAGDNEYVVVVEVRSGEGERERKGQRAIRVRVSDEEEPPEITSTGPFEVMENTTTVVQLEAVDPDEGDEVTGYGIAGGADGALFAVDEETGELTFREAPDYENPGDVESAEPQSEAGDNEYVVVVEVRSGEGERERKGQRAIRVGVSDEEEPPEITGTGPFEVMENTTTVVQLEAADPDEGDEVTGYGIAGGADGALFAVDEETGELSFREAPDYENPGDVESAEPESGAGDNEYIVVVEVSSGEGERERKGERAIRVWVSDEEEPPEAPAAPAVTPEGSDSLKVSWTEPENRGPAITDYDVRYREEGEEGYSDGGHEGTGLEGTLSGLKEGTVYEVQVRAVNEEGIGDWSEPGEGTTETTEPDPDDPSDFTEEDLEGRRLTLRLTDEEGAAGSLELRFGEGNRFEQAESAGTYTYEWTGPGMGTLGLDYDDGSSCEVSLTFTGTGVGTFSYDCGDGNPAEGSFRLTTGSLFIPVILSSAGRNNSFFTSEMTLTNRGEQDVSLYYTYTAERGGGSGTASEVLPAGRQRVKSDALGYLIGLGVPIPESGNRIGTLRVEARLGSEVEAVVRTTTEVPEGRAGLAYLGVAEEEGFSEAVYLCGLRQNSRDRSNLAFQNMGAPEEGAVTLRATVYSGEASDTSPRVLEDITLEPGGFHQYSPVLGVLESADGDRQGYVKVERVEGEAPFYAYGVINDQANSDGSFVFPVTASSLQGKMGQTLPVIVETSEFRSELTVTNFSGEARILDLEFVAEGIEASGNAAAFSLSLEGGQQQIIPDVVAELRSRGVAGLSTGNRALAGAVFATAVEADMSGIVIGARTGSEGGGGQYSVFYNAVPFGEAFTEVAWVEGLQQNQENRSNLALVNTGEVDDSESVFHLEIYDGETGLLAQTVVTRPVPARSWHQINGILGSYAPETRQGYIRILKVSGENPFLAYGVVNDGGAPGERSGDGAYLPARE